MLSKVKVLVCGDVLGRLPELEAKVVAVNASHGPFSAVFCTGTMFETSFDPLGAHVQVEMVRAWSRFRMASYPWLRL